MVQRVLCVLLGNRRGVDKGFFSDFVAASMKRIHSDACQDRTAALHSTLLVLALRGITTLCNTSTPNEAVTA